MTPSEDESDGTMGDPDELGIGDALRQARERAGLDMATAEERTKIRGKYLRALENEDWDVLPGPAYVRGFLRTYASLLGLDGEVLADTYRHRFEEPDTAAYPVGEPVLGSESKGRGGGPSSLARRGPLIGIVIAALIVVLLVLGLLAGDDEEAPDVGTQEERPAREADRGEVPRGRDRDPSGPPVSLRLIPRSSVQVCLVGADGTPLIDSQVLSADAGGESFEGKRFDLDLDSAGDLDVRINGEREPITAGGPVSFEVRAGGLRQLTYAGPECP